MLKLDRVSRPLHHLRDSYLDNLSEPQELFLESLVASGVTWQYQDIAYAISSGDRLVEFYVSPNHIDCIDEFYSAAMQASKASSAICKSYDSQFLHAALSKPANVKPGGLLFRRIVDTSYQSRSDGLVRAGTTTDIDAVFGINDDFFDSSEEIESYVASDGLFVLEVNSEIVGCGIGKRVFENRKDIDIGMLVASDHRRKGFGTQLVSFLKSHYLKNGLNPICGCGPNNIESRRTLEKAGFVSEHRFLYIRY